MQRAGLAYRGWIANHRVPLVFAEHGVTVHVPRRPYVRALPGSAEAIPLPDSSVDAVLAGNALHWFDMTVAGPEIVRVLAPGGIMAGLWNVICLANAYTPQF